MKLTYISCWTFPSYFLSEVFSNVLYKKCLKLIPLSYCHYFTITEVSDNGAFFSTFSVCLNKLFSFFSYVSIFFLWSYVTAAKRNSQIIKYFCMLSNALSNTPNLGVALSCSEPELSKPWKEVRPWTQPIIVLFDTV